MSRRRQMIIISMFVFLTLCVVFCLISYNSAAGRLEAQKAARRWAGESGERAAQVSCFFPVGREIDEGAIRSFRETVEAKLLEVSIEAPETGRLFADAWSAGAEVTAESDRASARTYVTGVGGDFFLFHPLRLRSGAYISGDDLMRDRVVLDEEMAWKLFGALDVAGFTLTIDGENYIVAGVVERETDAHSKAAYTDGDSMFVPYEALKPDDEAGISCYEIVMPDPISGFALGLAEEKFGNTADITENSKRYGLGSIFGVLFDYSERVMRRDGMAYPYWENAARLAENKMAALLFAMLIFSLFPLICIVTASVFVFKRGRRKIRAAVLVFLNSREERLLKRYTENRRKKYGEHYAEEYNEDI